MFAWLLLLLTILLEVAGSTMMKLANGFSEFWPSVGVFVFYSAALAGLTMTLKYIELSIAYAIWSGTGTALIAVIGIWYFREPVTVMKVASLCLVIAGVVGLQLASEHSVS
ncbi:MAG: DMT family transporter [Hyphomicrobiaceae bacterium]